jgi:hypothetical protein
MTIFGFNSVVKHQDAEYHVQSEARPHDLVLQTLIFVKGQCVGKHTYSYAAKTLEAGFSEDAMHELLKAQHKAIIDALNAGNMDPVLSSAGEVYDVGGSKLFVKWTNPNAGMPGPGIHMDFQVYESGQAVKGAEVVVFPCPPARPAVMARALTDSSGGAKLTFPITQEVEHDGGVMVQATHRGRSTTRKFRFKK